MTGSIFYLVTAMVLSRSLQNFAKRNKLHQFENYFRISLFFSVFLYIAQIIFSDGRVFDWVWHIYLLALLGFCYQRKTMGEMRVLLQAFAPYILVSCLTDFLKIVSFSFFTDGYGRYVNYAATAAFVWMLAALYSNNRQLKAAEKERVARQKEDELNRAIARRKVELEGLVAERTKELLDQKEELQLTVDELRTTQTQLIQAEKMASLGELTAGIAHEIQNPLNFVNNFAELNVELIDELEEERLKPESQRDVALEAELLNDIKQNLEKINHHGKRADAIVKGMLLHSRKSTGQKEPTDINALADEYLRLSYHGLRAKDKSFNAAIQTNFDTSSGKVNIVPQDVGRVLLNLYNNAFYAVAEKNIALQGKSDYQPTVSVSTKNDGDKIEIRVGDNGNGIPQKILDKIFQPFFTTKPTGQGTGLGLSLSYDIVKAHGGEINVETKEGQGTEFILLLPVK